MFRSSLSEDKPLLENYYTKPPPGTSSVRIQPRSAAALRYQFIAKLGGPVSSFNCSLYFLFNIINSIINE